MHEGFEGYFELILPSFIFTPTISCQNLPQKISLPNLSPSWWRLLYRLNHFIGVFNNFDIFLRTFEPCWKFLQSSTEKLANVHSQVIQHLNDVSKAVREYGEQHKDKQKQVRKTLFENFICIYLKLVLFKQKIQSKLEKWLIGTINLEQVILNKFLFQLNRN